MLAWPRCGLLGGPVRRAARGLAPLAVEVCLAGERLSAYTKWRVLLYTPAGLAILPQLRHHFYMKGANRFYVMLFVKCLLTCVNKQL